MVVPELTNATAAHTQNLTPHTAQNPSNGFHPSSSDGDTSTARADPRANELTTGNGSTPLSCDENAMGGREGANDETHLTPRRRRYDDERREEGGPQSPRRDRHHDHQDPAPRQPVSTQPGGQSESVRDLNTSVRRKPQRHENKSTIRLATLNMNGFGCLTQDHQDNKWGRIYRMMSDHRIGILFLQETHLTSERKADLHRMFARKVKIFHSSCPDAPTQREGVAIVLNSKFIDMTGATAVEIIPGRALQLSMTCLGGERRNFLCVYAPTSSGANERRLFFDDVRRYYETHPDFPRPDVMAGDFNNVEDTIDRLPTSDGPDQSVPALDDLKISLNLMFTDGWRATYPNIRDFTFHRGSGSNAVFSRLDRIYVSLETFEYAREWNLCEAGVRTDHALVSVQLTSKNAPIVGPGRPIFPLSLLRDKKLAKGIKRQGIEAMRQLTELEIAESRSDERNPQTILHKFKKEIMAMARSQESHP